MPEDDSLSPQQLRRACRQQLESLRRAGVTHLPKRPAGYVISGSGEAGAAIPAANVPHEKQRAASAAEPTQAVKHGAVTSSGVTPNTLLADDAPAGDSLARIALEVAACTRCAELASTRTQTVPGVGNDHCRLLFLGEAPGADEDRLGEPFVGRAGQLLTQMIENGMGLKRGDVFIANVLKCRPPGNRTPAPQEAANCRKFLDRQLALLRPEFICCLGAVAAQNLLATDRAIGRLRGQFFDYRGSRVLCTYHPAYLLRNPAAKKETWADLQLLMEAMGLPLPTPASQPNP